MLGIVAALALVLSAGCASHGQFRYQAPETAVEWPAPPDPPRFRFVGRLTGEDNFVKEQDGASAVKKAFAWVVGLVLGEGRPRVLMRPQGVYVDAAAERIYVTDVGRKAVFVFDRTEGRLHIWENGPDGGGLGTPVAIAPGAPGELLVTDSQGGRVIRLNTEGKPLGSFGGDVLQRPTGIARDPDHDRVYVADAKGHAIHRFDTAGRHLGRFGHKGSAEGELNGPTHLAYKDGQLYVVDTLNSRVQIFDPDGKFLRGFGKRGMYIGDMPRPKGVAVDSEGHIYVVESYYDYLLVYDAQGRPLLPIGGTGAGIGQFYLPAGIWIDASDRVYVADMFNGRVMVFQYLGTRTPVKGERPEAEPAPKVTHENQ